MRLAAAALGFSLLAGIGCEDDATRLESHRVRGQTYFEEEKHPEAIIEFKNVLQLDPNDAGAHFGLARAYLALGDGKARWELQETVRLDPSNHEARLILANLVYYAGLYSRTQGDRTDESFEAVVEHADAVLAADADHVDALLTRGKALAELRRNEEAGASLTRALELAPERSEALFMLASFHRSQGDRIAAEPLFRRLTDLDPGFGSHRALAAFLAADPERDPEALAAYERAVEVAEEEQLALAVQLLAGFHYSRERFDEAEAALRAGLDRSGANLEIVLALARYLHVRGQSDQADAVIEDATRARPDEVRPYLILSAYRGQRGDPEGALEAAEAALEVDPTDKSARLRRAELLVDLGYQGQDVARIAQGQSIVDAILATEENDPQALFVRGKLELAQSRPADAVASLRQTVESRPDWAQAHFVLGSALYALGERADAREQLSRALEIDASLLAARRILLQVQASLGEFDLVIEDGKRILSVQPGDQKTRVLVAQALVRERRFKEARAELEQVPAEERNAEIHYALARIQRMEGELELARQGFELARALDPDHPDVLAALLELDIAQDRLSESLERMSAAVEANPESSSLLQLRGLTEWRAGQTVRAEESFRKAIELDPNDLSAYQRLGEFLARTGRAEEMMTTYEEALAARPDSGRLNLVVGILHEGTGRQDSALEHYEAAIRLDPGLAAAKNNLAYLLAERGKDLDRALDLAQDAKAALPDNANTADTLGWVLYKKNIPSAAIGYLKEAEGGFAREDPALGIVRRHLALAYEANGEAEQARNVIDRALEELAEQQALLETETGRPAGEPAWASELRSLRSRLDAAPDA
ncbi:MAG: tetratricopeptide repeat protein [Myxococcota bacterium]